MMVFSIGMWDSTNLISSFLTKPSLSKSYLEQVRDSWLHVEGQFDLGFKVGVVNFEEAMYELFEIDVTISIQI